MREMAYHLLDVFTDVPFGGNQLAVFLDGTGITPEMMQRIARELNLSETVFVLPPQDAANHFRLRIFTPGAELPFAGHPTNSRASSGWPRIGDDAAARSPVRPRI